MLTIVKENALYNSADNLIYVKSHRDKIFVICNNMEQVDEVQKRLHKHGNTMIDFEEWDEDEDMKWILTFKVFDDEQLPEKN